MASVGRLRNLRRKKTASQVEEARDNRGSSRHTGGMRFFYLPILLPLVAAPAVLIAACSDAHAPAGAESDSSILQRDPSNHDSADASDVQAASKDGTGDAASTTTADADLDAKPADDASVGDGGPCDASVTLAGTGLGHVLKTVGPFTVGEAVICVHLDASAMTDGQPTAVFTASTDPEAGPTSSFTIVMKDGAGAVVATGHDVAIGVSNTTSYATALTGFAQNTPRDLVVHVRLKDGLAARSTQVHLDLGLKPFN